MAKTKRKKRSSSGRKRKSKRGSRLFTRASALAGMHKCPRCHRTIFGGPKGMRTHMRKKHRR